VQKHFTFAYSVMRNTTKLKLILQIYKVSLEMDEEEILHFTLIDKRNGKSETFTDQSYSVVIRRAFVYMNKSLVKHKKIHKKYE
jgi:hypothetical protein